MTEDLKPCPFCGCKAEIHPHIFYGIPESYTIDCSNNECPASYMCGVLFGTEEEAIDVWNRRVSE